MEIGVVCRLTSETATPNTGLSALNTITTRSASRVERREFQATTVERLMRGLEDDIPGPDRRTPDRALRDLRPVPGARRQLGEVEENRP